MVGKGAHDLYADFAVLDSPIFLGTKKLGQRIRERQDRFLPSDDEMIHTPREATAMEKIRLTLVGDEVRAAREEHA